MSTFTVGTTIFLYLVTSFYCFREEDYPHSLMWFAYGLANVGLLWYEIQKQKGS